MDNYRHIKVLSTLLSTIKSDSLNCIHAVTDLTTAWDLWEEVRNTGLYCCMELTTYICEDYSVLWKDCEPEGNSKVYIPRALTPAIAIVLAYLQHKGVDISKFREVLYGL